MADMVMPKYLPCTFDKGWAGKCGKPTDNGCCTEHEQLKCVCCGERAFRLCDYTGSMPCVCGQPLCRSCGHEPYIPGTTDFPQKHLPEGELHEANGKAMAALKAGN